MKLRSLKFALYFSLAVIAGGAMSVMNVRANGDGSYQTDYLSMKTVEEMYIAYHLRTNELFNEATKKIIANEGVVEVSEDDSEQDRMCEKVNNVASICISNLALYEYRGYEEAMRIALQNPQINLFKNTPESKSHAEVFNSQNAKIAFIKNEVGTDENDLGTALYTLQFTLDYYNEFMTAHTMHEDNKRLITALEAYNQNLANLRTQTYSLPAKFHNTTTTGGECT